MEEKKNSKGASLNFKDEGLIIKLDCSRDPFKDIVSNTDSFYSFQNIKYFKHIAALAGGEWNYDTARFSPMQYQHFTLDEFKKLAKKAEMEIIKMYEEDAETHEKNMEKASEISYGLLTLRKSDYSEKEWHEFFVKGYKVQCIKADKMQKSFSTAAPMEKYTVHERLSHIRNLINQKDYNTALNLLIPLVEEEPDNWSVLNTMGLVAWYKGALGDAFLWFEKGLEENPVSADLLMNFSDAGLALGKNEKVLDILDRALSLDPSLKEIRILADKIRLEKRFGVNSASFSKIVTARELNHAGENLIREGMMDKAEEIFLDILKADDRDFVAYNNLGLVHWYRQQAQNAYDCFQASLEINPCFEDAVVNIFDAALNLKKIKEILPLVQKAIRAEPSLKDVKVVEREILSRGEKIYENKNYQALAQSSILVEQGFKLLDELKIDQATLKFLDELEINPESSRAFNGLGMIAYYRGMLTEAFTFFNRSLD
ncbi:MAG: hypothetical protein ABIA63_05435, partial [bacterium]